MDRAADPQRNPLIISHLLLFFHLAERKGHRHERSDHRHQHFRLGGLFLIKPAGIGCVAGLPPFPRRPHRRTTRGPYLREKEHARAGKTPGLGIMGVTPLPGLRGRPTRLPGQSATRLAKPHARMVRARRAATGTCATTASCCAVSRARPRRTASSCGRWPTTGHRPLCQGRGSRAGLTPPDRQRRPQPRGRRPRAGRRLRFRLFREILISLWQTASQGPTPASITAAWTVTSAAWPRGGPRNWAACIEDFARIAGAKIAGQRVGLRLEGGAVMSRQKDPRMPERRASSRNGSTDGRRALARTAGGFCSEVFTILHAAAQPCARRVFLRWEDQEKCWQCGHADCPLEQPGRLDSCR